jgi:hypothetical protein
VPISHTQRRFEIKSLMIYLKFIEQQDLAKPKITGWKEIIKIRAEINGMETKKRDKLSMKQIESLEI